MGSSGGGGTQRVIQDLPEWSKPYWQGIASQGRALAREPFQQYQGQRIAGFTPMERQAFEGVQTIYDQGARPELDQARGIATQASQVGFDTPMFPDQAQKYMNPYLENVLDLGRDRMMSDYQGAMGDARRRSSDAAIQSGIMGGRGTLMGAREAGRVSDEAFRAMREYEADTRFRAFDQAQQAFASDVAARQAGARIGLDAGSQLQALAQTQQAQALERINALQQAGVRGREMQQAIRDQAYQDFLDRRDWRRNQLKEYVGILSGTPYATAINQTTRSGGGGPGIGQTIAGLGIAGLGAYGAYKGG
ncbi:MAG: hypothetical protein GOVbin2729_63 [Prokaryotic dsDNA virus sp.]|nr:MAG: hypothetical protein GOVbin2729_63 [Prokaryotic dsDNA virus sp.]|tara:strand:- start:2839 stop:3756 length:918 start_codon:yes stop_codon:yes gene_type:complete